MVPAHYLNPVIAHLSYPAHSKGVGTMMVDPKFLNKGRQYVHLGTKAKILAWGDGVKIIHVA